MTVAFIFFHVLFCIALITLVLMHSGAQAGLGAVGGGASAGGQHVMERNLDRLTVIVAVLYVITTLVLQRIY